MGNRFIHSQFGKHSRWRSLGMVHSGELICNLATGQEAEKYTVDGIDTHKLEIELAVYQLRMHELTGCVRVLYYSLEKSLTICGPADCFIVLTQHTDRLSDIGRISLKQARILLRECLDGFDELFSVFGLFQIEASFISISQEGKTRVWLNSNYGMNTIEQDPSSANTEQRQIRRLVGIIQRKIALEELPVDFGNQILRAETFDEAILILDGLNKRPSTIQTRQQQQQQQLQKQQQKSRIAQNPLVKELKKARAQQLDNDMRAIEHYHLQTREDPSVVNARIEAARLANFKSGRILYDIPSLNSVPAVIPKLPSIYAKPSPPVSQQQSSRINSQKPETGLSRKQSTPQLPAYPLDQTFGRQRKFSKEDAKNQPQPQGAPKPNQQMSRAVHTRNFSMADSLIHHADLRGDRMKQIPQVDSMLVIQPAPSQQLSRAHYIESRVITHP